MARALLQKLRATIRAVVPEAEECISYRIPAFRYEARIAELTSRRRRAT